MPLKLVAPRTGKSPNFTIRGSYLGVAVNKSCGTDKRSVARAILAKLERAIESGEYPPKQVATSGERTFLRAAVEYMEAGRRARYVARLIKHFGATPLAEIDQAAIDAAAIELFPNATPGTRNTCVYTPLSAILHHAGVNLKLRRPKGAKGRVVTDWLRHEDARGIIQAADNMEAEFGLLLRFLLFTGLRLGEVLALSWSDIDLESGTAWVTRKKGGIASDVRMRDDLRIRMAAHGPREPHRRQANARQARLSRASLPRPAAYGMDAATEPPRVGKLPAYFRDMDAPRWHRRSGACRYWQLARCQVSGSLCARRTARRVEARGRFAKRGKDVESVLGLSNPLS
jgi:integrase